MGFLAACIGVKDALGILVSRALDGTTPPFRLVMGDGMTARTAMNGGVPEVTLSAEASDAAAIAAEFGIVPVSLQTVYAAVSDWYVSATGTRSGTGTAANDPILPAELSRRLKGVTMTVTGFMTVHYDAAGDPTGTLIETWNTPTGCQVVIQGTPTSLGITGTLTAWIAINTTSTASSYGFTDSALSTAGAWTAPAAAKARIRIVGGARDGLCLAVVKDENTNPTPVPKTARVAPPHLATLTYPFNSSTTFVHTTPVAGDAYVVETLPSLGGVQRAGTFAPNSSVNGVNIGIIFRDINVVDCAIDPPPGNAVAYLNCNVGLMHPIDSGQFFLLGGQCAGVDSNGGKIVAKGVAFAGSQIGANQGATIWLQDCLSQATFMGIDAAAKVRILPGSGDGLQFFDVIAASFAIGGQLLAQAVISGANNGSATMAQITDGGKFPWTVLPTIPGQVLVDNIVYSGWGTGQMVDRLTGSAMFPNVTGAGPAFYTYAIRFTGSAAAIAEFALCRLSSSGTIVAAYFLPDATSNPAIGSNSQTLTLGKRSGASTGGSPTAVATFVLSNANSFGGCTAFEDAPFGSISNGTFTDGNILTLSTTLVGTATVPSGVLIVVTQ